MKKTEFLIGISKYFTYSKPTAERAAIITNSIIKSKCDGFAIKKALLNGYSIRPAIFDEDDFVSQQLFFVDVDNSDEIHSVEKNLMICKKIGVIPLIVYGTFSFNSLNQKHRLVFATNEPVCSLEERETIIDGLNSLFGGDVSTKNIKRIFYPGKVQFFFNPFFANDNKKLLEVCNCALLSTK